jgi:uncharacterized membrane protein
MHQNRSFLVPSLLWLAILSYALYFSYLTIVRYAAFEARALDLGNLNQAIWNTAYGQPFHFTNQPGAVNRLSLHVEPILLPIAWLYRLYPAPPLLLGLQATVVALGAWPLYLLARHRLRHTWLALLFGLLFLLNPSVQAANWLEFHPVTLAPTFLIAAFYALVRGRVGWFAGFAVLAASCKEEIALLIFMLGLYALVVLRRPRLGVVTMALSLSWALLAVLVIQQRFAAGNIHWGRYAYLGETPAQIVWTLLTQPGLVLAQLQKANVLTYCTLLLLPVGFLALLAPEIVLLALPSLGINLLADFPPMHRVTELIYAAPIAPFVLIAAVYGAARLHNWVACVPQFTTHNSQLTIHNSRVSGLISLLVILAAGYTHYHYGYLPGGGNHRLYPITEHDRRGAALIAQIPAEAKVSAQDRLNPHVSGRATVYIFPRIDDADTVFLDVTGPAWPQHPVDLRRTVDELLAGDFGVAAAEDGYLLLRKGVADDQLPGAFYTAFRRPGYVAENPARLWFGDAIELLDYRVTRDDHGELITEFYWQLTSPTTQEYQFYIGYLDRRGTVLHDTQFYPPVVTLWYPTSQWQPGEPVLVQTLPWTLDVEQFTLVIGVYIGEDGWSTGERLALSAGPTPERVYFDNSTVVRLGGYRRASDGAWRAVEVPHRAPPAPLYASFANGRFGLEGVTLASPIAGPGDALRFDLHWRAGERVRIDFDYALFAHLLDASGNKVAQLDWQPRDALGPRPMTSWLQGDSVLDEQSFLLPAELAPGTYRLVIGAYNWQTGERLPVIGDAVAPGDVVTIATIQIE